MMATGHCGTIKGRQTVPRAELQALITFLQFINMWEGQPGPIKIHTDSALVNDGHKKGRLNINKKNGEMWAELWDELDIANEK